MSDEQQGLELRVKYPTIQPRRYCAVFRQDDNSKLMISPDPFFFGDVLRTPRGELNAQARVWFEHRKKTQFKGGLFDFSDREYLLFTGEKKADGRLQGRKRELIQLTPQQFLFALEKKIRQREGSYKIWRVGGENTFKAQRKRTSKTDTHAGTVVLSASVQSKRRGAYSVSVTGPFATSEQLYADLDCTCPDFTKTQGKQGLDKVQFPCVHLGSLLELAAQEPGRVRNLTTLLKTTHGKIFLPFHTEGMQSHDDFPVDGEEDASNLGMTLTKMDAVVHNYFNQGSLYDIGVALMRLPYVFDEKLIGMLATGDLTFEVLAQKFPFPRAERLAAKYSGQSENPVRELYRHMSSSLGNAGFELSGMAREKVGGPWEGVALLYRNPENPGRTARLLFSDKYPPVLIQRDEVEGAASQFPQEPYDGVHPFAELFQARQGLDDVTRRQSTYKILIPTMVGVFDAVRRDYHDAIEAHYPGGGDGLRTDQRLDTKRTNDQAETQRKHLLEIVTA